MPSIINSDDGVVSGTSGLKTTGGNDGITAFQQNGTERMRIDSSGNVGIGTTTMNGVLNIGGTGNVYASSGATFYTGGDFYIRAGTSGILRLGANNINDYMIINTSGNVGIGTNSPGARLDVNGTARFNTTIGVGNTAPSSSGAGITFPATQSASTNANTLDDYEEGTWTPSVSSSGGSITTYTSTGTYTKIGRIVVASGNVFLNNVGTASGRLQIVPPFTAQTATSIRYIGCGNESQALGTFYQVFNISSTNFIFKTTTNGDITWTNNYQYEFEFTFETT